MASWIHKRVLQFPWTANALVAGTCSCCGDAITQRASEPEFDAKRNVAFVAFGAFWSVPGRFLYSALARYVPSDTLTNAVKGALISELCFDLPITNPVFMATTDTLRGRDAQFILDHLHRDYRDCAISSFCMWFPATVVNLRLVPLPYRVIFDNVMCVVWASLFSFLSNRRCDSPTAELAPT